MFGFRASRGFQKTAYMGFKTRACQFKFSTQSYMIQNQYKEITNLLCRSLPVPNLSVLNIQNMRQLIQRCKVQTSLESIILQGMYHYRIEFINQQMWRLVSFNIYTLGTPTLSMSCTVRSIDLSIINE